MVFRLWIVNMSLLLEAGLDLMVSVRSLAQSVVERVSLIMFTTGVAAVQVGEFRAAHSFGFVQVHEHLGRVLVSEVLDKFEYHVGGHHVVEFLFLVMVL